MRNFVLILIFLLSLCTNIDFLFAATSIASVTVKGQIPEGVSVGKKKVTVKKGYVVEKISATRAIAKRRGGGGTGITGEFDCTCNGSQGGCSVVTTPNSVTCASNGCSSCYMIVTIPDKAGSIMRQ